MTPPLVQAPRPLPLHLALQTLLWISSAAALPSLRNGSLIWNPKLKKDGAALAESLQKVDPERFHDALEAEAKRRLNDFTKGIDAYRRQARAAPPPPPPVVWSEGPVRLLDYGATARGPKNGPPLLVVPSLVNRATILDLSKRKSLLRFLAGKGFRPFLIDWGTPGEAERRYGLDEYILGPLQGALEAAVNITGRPAVLIGYCMGGLLALASAIRNPERTTAFCALATPWDFHAGDGARARLLRATAPQFQILLDTLGFLPVDILQAFFTGLSPFATGDKFRRFSTMDKRTSRANDFAALEDWINDGVPLAGPVAKDCLFGWYMENRPHKGRWRVGGQCVRPGDLKVPSLVVLPEHDRIVPPPSARALAASLPGAQTLSPHAGHIGMIAGSASIPALFEPLSQWLEKVSG